MFLRDDIHQFSHNIRLLDHNAKAFRKRKSASLTSGSSTLINAHLSTQYSQTKHAYQELKSVSADKKIPQKDVKVTVRKLTKTAAGKKRSHVTDSIQPSFTRMVRQTKSSISAHNMVPGSQIGHLEQEKPDQTNQNKQVALFTKTQRKNSKVCQPRTLKNASLLQWINAVLIENMREQINDSLPLAAIKKYRIDPACLSAQRISQDNISRIYKSLYVYSSGFSSFLKEITGNSQKLYNSLWTVFAILLQHCSGEPLQTLLETLNQQKIKVISEYQEELQKKQKMIDYNEQLNAQKNQKIYKDIKVKTIQNQLLHVEKDIIQNDWRTTEKALTDEVALRMLFQQKINGVHYVYRQISDKHELLFKDYKRKMVQLEKLNEEIKVIRQQSQTANKDNQGLKQMNLSLSNEVQALKNQVKRLAGKMSSQASFSKNKSMQHASLLKQLTQSKCSIIQLKKELQNTEKQLSLIQNSYNELQTSYETVLKENHRVLTALEQLNIINNGLCDERDALTQSQLGFHNQKAFLEYQMKEKEEIVIEFKMQIKNLNDEIYSLELQRQTLEETIDNLRADIDTCYKNKESYRLKCQQLANTVTETLRELHLLKETSYNRETNIPVLRQETHKLKDKISKHLKTQHQLNSELKLLKLELDGVNKEKKDEILKSQETIRSLQNKIKQQQKTIYIKQKQAKIFKQLHQNANLALNDQKFERKTLDFSYRHTLAVLESHTQVIKQLKTNIGQCEDRLDNEKTKNQIENQKLQIKIRQLEMHIEENQQFIANSKELLQKRKQYVHPMVHEDVRCSLIRKQQDNVQISRMIKQLNQTLSKKSQQYLTSMKQKEEDLSRAHDRIKEQKQMHSAELEYEQQKYVEYVKKIQELETEITKLQVKARTPVNQWRQKERRYLQVIKQKGQKINLLMKEVQQMHDKYHRLIGQISQRQSFIHNQRSQINAIQEEKYALETQRNNAIQESEQLALQKLNFIERIKSCDGSQYLELRESLRRTGTMHISALRSFFDEEIRVTQKSWGKSVSGDKDKNSSKQRSRQCSPGPKERKTYAAGWRVDLSRKIKNATQYYSKANK